MLTDDPANVNTQGFSVGCPKGYVDWAKECTPAWGNVNVKSVGDGDTVFEGESVEDEDSEGVLSVLEIPTIG